jgi:cytoskeletal protein CcmA (bactofilin family)
MTTIGTSLVITGEVTSKEDITIHGQVKGQISMLEGSLLVAPTARIEADVDVTSVTIHGNMSGKVAAAERVELTPTAKMKGTLIAPAVILREGATFNGKIQVEKKGGSASRPAAKVS